MAVGSRRMETAHNAFADLFDVPNRHVELRALVEDPEVDVALRGHPTHRCITPRTRSSPCDAGKPALVEKAFTMNAAEARQPGGPLARAEGLFLMEAMWTRFLPHIAEIRRLLAEGALGEIVTVTADHGQWFAEDSDFRLFAPALGGGALLDLGIYPVSFASMVLGAPERIVSIVSPAFTGVDGQTSMVFAHAGGAHAVLTCTLAAKTPTRAAIVGTEARIEIDGDFYAPTSFTLIPRTGEETRFDDHHEGRGLSTRPTRSRAACARASSRVRSCPSMRASPSCRRSTPCLPRDSATDQANGYVWASGGRRKALGGRDGNRGADREDVG